MLKLGEKIISDIYLGDKKIAKVFLGDKLVYQAGKPIFLDYIESVGSYDSGAYIDTGITFTENHKIEICWQASIVNEGTSYYSVCGTRTQDTKGLWISYGATNKLYVSWGNQFSYTDSNYLKKHIAIVSKEGTYVDGVLKRSHENITFPTLNHTMLLFARWLGEQRNYSNGCRIFDCKIYENDILIQNLRPCIDPKGTVCFYDMVTKKYFYNQGTGTLKAGGRFVESIVSDGNCYINTGIKASYDYTIKTKYMYTSFVGAYNCIFGTRSEAVSQGNKIYWVGCNSTGTKDLMLRLGKTTSPYSLKLNEVINLEITPNEAIINGTNLGDAMFDGEIGFDSSIYLFNINMNSDGSTALFASVARMYNFQIYNNNMELIQDLRPYVDADGVACFKDLVTNTLLYNQGTGTLTYTEV